MKRFHHHSTWQTDPFFFFKKTRAKKNQIQHPRSSKHRRSNIPFQNVYVDMCYNPYYTEITNNPNEKIETNKMLKSDENAEFFFCVFLIFKNSR